MCARGLPASALICHFTQAEFLHHFIAFAPEILDNPLKKVTASVNTYKRR